MIKKFALLLVLISFTACETVREKTGGLKKIGDTCPPKGERTLKHIFCKEPK